MQSYEIILGFSDIKKQLINKCGLNKSVQELVIWFSQRENEIYVHDNANHNANMLIALVVGGDNKYYLEANSFGLRTVIYYLSEPLGENEKYAEILNEGYKLLGFRNKF
jgi:hypothetical protein